MKRRQQGSGEGETLQELQIGNERFGSLPDPQGHGTFAVALF
jgi:hypothetical protein